MKAYRATLARLHAEGIEAIEKHSTTVLSDLLVKSLRTLNRTAKKFKNRALHRTAPQTFSKIAHRTAPHCRKNFSNSQLHRNKFSKVLK